LPSVDEVKSFVELGGVMSYGPNMPAMWRRAAYYADGILKGAKPADLPMEPATTFELVINLKTTQALGLTIPQPSSSSALPEDFGQTGPPSKPP
jgi:putative ABC transport system substrate-binding protein